GVLQELLAPRRGARRKPSAAGDAKQLYVRCIPIDQPVVFSAVRADGNEQHAVPLNTLRRETATDCNQHSFSATKQGFLPCQRSCAHPNFDRDDAASSRVAVPLASWRDAATTARARGAAASAAFDAGVVDPIPNAGRPCVRGDLGLSD